MGAVHTGTGDAVSSEVQIPFGYKRVDPYAQTQKGDGKWDGTRFVKVKKEWPRAGEGEVIIRRCEIKQVEMGLEP